MSDAKRPSQIDVAGLKAHQKDASPLVVEEIDRRAAELGFEDRGGRGRRGRKPSPRTGQVHARVLPGFAEAISDEARRRGVQQGVLIEEAWALYCARNGLEPPQPETDAASDAGD